VVRGGGVVVFLVQFRTALLSSLVFCGFALGASASAETLNEALSAAYRSNPTLQAERANLRATDELVPQALSGWRPTITGQASVAHVWSNTDVNGASELNQADVNISLSQPLFRGFKTVEGTKAAEARVKAERQQLLATEQSVLFAGVQAYANVVRDRQILGLRRKNVGFLQKQLNASSARFNAGELTRTDVAQSRASLSGAKAQLAASQSQLQASEASYVAVIGRKPGKLAAPRMAKRPPSLDSALAIAQETNPSILAAAQIEDSAQHQVEVIKGDLLPSLTLNGSIDSNINPSSFVATSETAKISGVLVVPFYEGGRIYSQVRQAKETASQNRIQVIGAVRTVRESVANAWNSLIADGQSLASTRDQMAAAALALDGVQQEYQVGSRTTIDVLNAQQTLLSAQITEVQAIREQVVASYQLQQAMGHLTSRHLGLGGYYDPKEHYNDVHDKWIGLSPEPGVN
jgi:outer membrane protein